MDDEKRRRWYEGVPVRTLAVALALITTIFLTRGRWEAWVVEKTIPVWPGCTDVIATKDGKRAATGAYGWYLAVWDMEAGRQLSRHSCSAWNDISPDCTHVIIRTVVFGKRATRTPARPGSPKQREHREYRRSRLELIDIRNGKRRFRLDAERAWAYDAKFICDGKKILAWHEDGKRRIWDVNTGEAVLAPADAAVADAVSSSANRVWPVAGTANGTCAIMNAETGERVVKLEGAADIHAGHYTLAQLLPDGKRIVGRNGGTGAKVWDARTGGTLFEFPASGPCCVLGDDLLICSQHRGELGIWRCIRPEWWWGVFALWHFWLIAVLSLALAVSIRRDVRSLRRR